MHPILVKILTSPAFWSLAEKVAVRVVEYLSTRDENDLTSEDVKRVEKAVKVDQSVRKNKKRPVGPRH